MTRTASQQSRPRVTAGEQFMAKVLTVLLQSRPPRTVNQIAIALRGCGVAPKRMIRSVLAYFMALGVVRRSGAGGAADPYRYEFAGWPRLPIRAHAATAAAPATACIETPPPHDLKHPPAGPPVRPPTGTNSAEVEEGR